MPKAWACWWRRASGPSDLHESERGVTTVALIVSGLVLLGAAGTVTYVATDGFGQSAEPVSAPAPDLSPDASATPVETQDPPASRMEAAFVDGQSVECTYTYEAYDATTTLQSKDVFRIDQQTQGGPAHVIRGPQRTQVWVEGMTEAMDFDTAAYEQATPGRYPTFDPTEFDTDALFDDGTCRSVTAVGDVFDLPADMSAAPATP